MNWYTFPEVRASKVRAVLWVTRDTKVGLSEFEAWGSGTRPVEPAPPLPGNFAKGAKATASFTSRFDHVEEAVDGVVAFTPEPRNRWTAYESPNAEDWLELDFGMAHEIGRVDLMLFDDGGGVRAPKSYRLQAWDGSAWQDIAKPSLDPAKPAGGIVNIATFPPVRASRLRVIFTHRDGARSGITEIEARAR